MSFVVSAQLATFFRSMARKLDSLTKDESAPPASDTLLNEYIDDFPSAQNAIDAVPGWNGALPADLDLRAGEAPLFADGRIQWALDQFGSVQGASILELGPMEGSHTYMVNLQRPRKIDAIEANKIAFLRCMIVKDLLNIDRARFLLGNFVKWLELNEETYDFVIASGVLYHMQDPLYLISLLAKRTNSFYLWTHYVSEVDMPMGDIRRQAFVGDCETKDYLGIPVKLYRRRYHGAWKSSAFCGGMYDLHSWIDKDDLLKAIEVSGFDDVRVAHDDPRHKSGPSFSIFARNTRR